MSELSMPSPSPDSARAEAVADHVGTPGPEPLLAGEVQDRTNAQARMAGRTVALLNIPRVAS